MRTLRHGSWGLGLGSALLLVVGCGGRAASDRVLDETATEGIAGKPGTQNPTRPDDGIDTPEPSEDGRDEPEPRPDELAAEIERIAGTSFALSQQPSQDLVDGHVCKGGSSREDLRFVGDVTYHLRKDDGGGLELVSSIPQPWLRVDTSKLTRTGSGWVVVTPPPTGGCLAYEFEEEEAVALPQPDSMELVFSGSDPDGKPSSIEIRAHFGASRYLDAAHLSAYGKRDHEPPTLRALPAYDVVPKLDQDPFPLTVSNIPSEPATFVPTYWFPWDLPRSFVFSEAIKPGWSVAIEDAAGTLVQLAESNGSEFEIGFDVARYYSEGYRWVVQGEDLAGNALEVAQPYPARELPLVDGTFESTTPLASHNYFAFIAHGGFKEAVTCDEQAYLELPCVGSSAPQHPETTALAGNSSLWFAGTVFLRIARQPDATVVTFDALAATGPVASLRVAVMSLDVGTSVGPAYLDVDGEALEPGAEEVRPVRTFTLPVASGTGDVLVGIQAPGVWYAEEALGIDSLRTE